MEGKFRDNHFNGVATVIEKLFQIIKPTKAYFGEKDIQQLQIVRISSKSNKFKNNYYWCAYCKREKWFSNELKK